MKQLRNFGKDYQKKMGVSEIAVFFLFFFVSSTIASDYSPYCGQVAKITNICNDIYGSLMLCTETCQKAKKPLQCGVAKNVSSYVNENEEGGEMGRRRNTPRRFRRIVGGRRTVDGEQPWLVSLRLNGVLKCNGAVLSKDWVLTAASCFDSDYSSLDPKDWQVFAGDYDFSKSENSEQQRGLKVIIKHDKNFQFWRSGHPEYPDDFDIALLKLSSSLTLNDQVSPICIPDPETDFGNAECSVAGWGRSQSSHVAHDVPHTARVQLIPRAVCNSKDAFKGSIHTRAICGEYKKGAPGVRTDACNQDSGSPLACMKNGRWQAVGLISWGYNCANGGLSAVYGVFTKVQYEEIKSWVVMTILGYSDVINASKPIPDMLKSISASFEKKKREKKKLVESVFAGN